MSRKSKSTKFHNKNAEEYEKSYEDPYWQLYFEITWHNVKKYLPKSKNSIILDAGGGTGYWSRRLAELGYRSVCTDVAEKMLDYGIKKSKKEKLKDRIEFRKLDILNMDCFADEFFDMVIAEGDPVSYCGDPEGAVSELARVVKKNSYVCVSVDNFYSTLGKLLINEDFRALAKLLKTNISEFAGEFPQYNFTIEKLKNLFKNCGLEVVEIIGKPIFARFLAKDKLNEMLKSKNFFNKLLQIENIYNNDPSIVGLGGHIQIIGKK